LKGAAHRRDDDEVDLGEKLVGEVRLEVSSQGGALGLAFGGQAGVGDGVVVWTTDLMLVGFYCVRTN
jgi:hypothetical protein